MSDYTGSYSTDVPVIPFNTASMIKHKAKFYNGSGSISIPLVKGTRFIVLSVITAGNNISIGFGQNAGTISDSRFTFTTAATTLDLSAFFANAPFTQYKEPSSSFVYLIITGTGAITAAVCAMKA